jgi:hypothetical protein
MAPSGFDQPASYRITISGRLDEAWSGQLRGLTIDNTSEIEPTCATLTGRLADQAALLGVLNALYDGRRVLLAVECLNAIEICSESSPGGSND